MNSEVKYKLITYGMPLDNDGYRRAVNVCSDLKLKEVQIEETDENNEPEVRFFQNGYSFVRVSQKDGQLELKLASQDDNIKAMSMFNTLFGDNFPAYKIVGQKELFQEINFAEISHFIYTIN